MKFQSLSWLPAACATRAARTESGPMKASDWNCRLTLPGRRYCLTIVGSWVSADSLQKGHWRSANSVIFTGALALPSVVPCCGTPAKSAAVALAPETDPDDEAAVEPVAVEPECEA